MRIEGEKHMPAYPEVSGFKASPLGAHVDKDGVVDLTFRLEDGNHIHVLLTPGGLETLSRHIQHVSATLRAQTDRQ
jgi:hypothetical protein